MPRKFKPGDWVKVRGKLTAPKMQVIKYVPKKDSIFGVVDHDNYLECVWYKNGERLLEVFHQRKLIKVMESGGLFQTFRTNPKLRLT
ncbi:hypothetical protein [Winogradskyella psychrotolerans]|uniref:hypothetical protein n=1 Tax=Winogradskyella psychrotolerans TaxID=1344585 RepID=UPI001C07A5D7|nr:hypothetical protein [Winogradskyella psychrotolerans]MBU2930160.1 hypothetical protein [Winogradskyella psychrotolerans]